MKIKRVEGVSGMNAARQTIRTIRQPDISGFAQFGVLDKKTAKEQSDEVIEEIRKRATNVGGVLEEIMHTADEHTRH